MSQKTTVQLDDKLYLLNSYIQYQINQIKSFCSGKMLTLVEAIISDKEQRKALKDIVRQSIWEKEFFSEEIADILLEFMEKYAPDVSREELYSWVNKKEKHSVNQWFK